ncbi:MAG: sulfatase-like hydrolase/transferase [Lachnospiraceae bacterium]|nr:sulfatase-like hydrolase/transferase [Lachnospiraceae bacterium]MCI1302321.1 sulfatase-like hydrolase/transferase [Lachnospiraceae bacterium]MCI1331487.1 sulfatase-like hydrolase/transferase [Lachnospiraceae bacterium]MCI1360828.1 sulfatase-like hydrolase/transferase [Lachnospiraceae bacterium]MCI1380078.1 sulfatase-like hydrolase/transferase [Lachnospiraceae bacterium]
MADQLRCDALGRGFTPNIDAIFSEGIKFDRAYCSCPLCAPSRASVFTGMYPATNGSLINPWMPDDEKYGLVKENIPTMYQTMAKDWEVIHSGKQHVFTEGGKLEDKENAVCWMANEKSYAEFVRKSGKRMPGGPKFRTLVPEMIGGKYTRAAVYSTPATGCYPENEAYYSDSYFAEKALEGMRNRKGDRPLFLSMMFFAPHPPFEIPEPWYSFIKKQDVVLPENVGMYYPRQSPLQMYNLTGVIGSRYSREEWTESWRVYWGLTAMLDFLVGKIISELKREGAYDNSLIIFCSDHGEMLGSHALFQKMCMYEESVHVPLAIRLPGGVHGGTHIPEAVSLIDVLPTIYDYLKIPVPEQVDGVSLRQRIENRSGTASSRDIFIQYDGNGTLSNFQRCVISDRYKLIVDLFKDEVFYELYDLKSDPQEQNNLLFTENIGSYDTAAGYLFAKLKNHMRDVSDWLRIPDFEPEVFRKNYQNLKVKLQ